MNSHEAETPIGGVAVPHRAKIIAFPFERLRALAQAEPAPLLADLVDPWCFSRRADGFRPRGIARYRDQIEQFLRFTGAIRIDALTTALIKAYKVELGGRCEPGTIRNALTALRALCDWLVEEDRLDTNPALSVEHPRVEPPAPDPLTRAQIDLLLAAIDAPPKSHKLTWSRNRRAILLMLYAGLRREETANLRCGDTDLDRREVIVRKGKGGRSRVVPMCDEVVDQGDGRGQGKPLTHKSLGHIFERWLRGRGLVIHPHQLRRTFATELYRQGEDLFTIQRLLGHSDPKTTLRYLGASSEREHAAVEKLRFRS
jgi:integrase/recombinase XerC